MDFKKIELLSCLKIEDSKKEQIEKSLNGVINMLNDLANINLNKEDKLLMPEITNLDKDSVSNDLKNKNDEILGIHLNSGYFLAPKVIKK